jgi:hypothetical protein
MITVLPKDAQARGFGGCPENYGKEKWSCHVNQMKLLTKQTTEIP